MKVLANKYPNKYFGPSDEVKTNLEIIMISEENAYNCKEININAHNCDHSGQIIHEKTAWRGAVSGSGRSL